MKPLKQFNTKKMTADNATRRDVSNAPIFVIGSSRSGTTLLYSILLSSGDFPVYEAETHLLDGCAVKYGNIKKRKRFNRFLKDWMNSKQFYRSGIDPEDFKKLAANHHSSYTEFLRFLMNTIAERQNKKRWVEQTPAHVLHLKKLSQAFPTAQYIHVIRDGRDVAISKRKLGWMNDKSKDPLIQLLYGVFDWENSVMAGRSYGQKLGNRYLEIRYEDMVTNIEVALQKINEFANLSINLDQIRRSSIGSLRAGNSAFNEGMIGVSSAALYRWKHLSTEREIKVVNSAVGKTLARLGYEVDGKQLLADRLSVWNVQIRKKVFQLMFAFRRILKEKTALGRFAASGLEIGLH